MRREYIQDERVVAKKRKIQSDAFQLLFLFLLGSIVVQQFVFDAPFSAYAVEFIGFFGASFYIMIRNIINGNDVFASKHSKKKLMVTNSLISGLSIALVTGFMGYTKYGSNVDEPGIFLFNMGISFIVASVSCFILMWVMNWFNTRRINQLEQELDEEEWD